MTIDYGLGYRNFCQISKNSELFFIEKNIVSYPIFEKTIGFLSTLNNVLYEIYSKRANSIKDPKHLNVSDEDLTEQSIVALCAMNVHSIWLALRPLENFSIHGCASIVRPVYESIPKMFYLLKKPEKSHIVILKEDFEHWKSQQKFNDFKNNKKISSSKEYLKQYLLTDDKKSGGQKFEERLKILSNNEIPEKFYEDFTRKYTNQWYRDQIYTNEKLKMIDAAYSSLSISSHANIARSRNSIQYDPALHPVMFKLLIDLAFFNLYILFNASYTAINEINEFDNAKNFIINLQMELKNHIAITDLYPNVPEFRDNLILRPKK